eukprot:CAMPEP_0206481344 /NCGR_PEP_ID=MMETSP0324_2-20121206/38082_1 /ASSEMBLY_ACC=CAM_ASM_000836 /TAXON_ID=2866 /ORGANISM="Crypthecodinium cohnii, Strain Seligo" /LENGTH=156 /DNA_ID=CAMNT_0053958801 /DNA_START=79 /DNA_END=551 /DNA_ORIENTATION=+
MAAPHSAGSFARSSHRGLPSKDQLGAPTLVARALPARPRQLQWSWQPLAAEAEAVVHPESPGLSGGDELLLLLHGGGAPPHEVRLQASRMTHHRHSGGGLHMCRWLAAVAGVTGTGVAALLEWLLEAAAAAAAAAAATEPPGAAMRRLDNSLLTSL